MATYKTKDGALTNGFVPGVGSIVDGVLSNAPSGLEIPGFVEVEAQTPSPAAPAAPVASPVPAVAAPATPTPNQETK